MNVGSKQFLKPEDSPGHSSYGGVLHGYVPFLVKAVSSF